jgi:hypothetical protein
MCDHDSGEILDDGLGKMIFVDNNLETTVIGTVDYETGRIQFIKENMRDENVLLFDSYSDDMLFTRKNIPILVETDINLNMIGKNQ